MKDKVPPTSENDRTVTLHLTPAEWWFVMCVRFGIPHDGRIMNLDDEDDPE